MNYLNPSWNSSWNPCFDQLTDQLETIDRYLTERSESATIYPPKELIFNAFSRTSAEAVKVVIIGQDPYHGPGEAMGLAFSVPPGIAIPPSLRNIFRERESDLGIAPTESGDLSRWADQGVLLINTALTVEADCAGSHGAIGWHEFTNQIIRWISDQPRPVVFVLWGNEAQKKRPLIDQNRHVVIASAHPSPLSAYRGFFGSRPFSLINQSLTDRGYPLIDWHNE